MEDIVPLYYNMRKADAELITNENIYKGLVTAYSGGNIGMISNEITKIWNSEEVDLDLIKLYCCINNFVIDYAKTLYKPEIPHSLKKKFAKYNKKKLPHFFIYAKDKKEGNVESINEKSIMGRLEMLIPNQRINFKLANVKKFNYKKLMKNPNVEIDNRIIEKYKELNTKRYFMLNMINDEPANKDYTFKIIREELLKIESDIYKVTDILVKYLFEKDSLYQDGLWYAFGDIILENLKNNLHKPLDDGYITCKACGKRVKDYNTKKYCGECAEKIWKEQVKINMRKYREKQRYKNQKSL